MKMNLTNISKVIFILLIINLQRWAVALATVKNTKNYRYQIKETNLKYFYINHIYGN